MTTKIPVTVEGNLTGDPEFGTSESGTNYARFSVAVNDRRQNQNTGEWEDAGTVFHRVVVFNQQAKNVATSLQKGDSVLVSGDLRFGSYTDKETGQQRETRDIVADSVGASLRYATVNVDRTPKASGPEAYATGPAAAPVSTIGAGIAR